MLWVRANHAVISRLATDTGINVAGCEIEKAIRPFSHIANPSKFVLPENLFIHNCRSTSSIEFQAMHVVRIIVVAQAKHREEHAAIPAWNRRAVVKRGAGGRK